MSKNTHHTEVHSPDENATVSPVFRSTSPLKESSKTRSRNHSHTLNTTPALRTVDNQSNTLFVPTSAFASSPPLPSMLKPHEITPSPLSISPIPNSSRARTSSTHSTTSTSSHASTATGRRFMHFTFGVDVPNTGSRLDAGGNSGEDVDAAPSRLESNANDHSPATRPHSTHTIATEFPEAPRLEPSQSLTSNASASRSLAFLDLPALPHPSADVADKHSPSGSSLDDSLSPTYFSGLQAKFRIPSPNSPQTGFPIPDTSSSHHLDAPVTPQHRTRAASATTDHQVAESGAPHVTPGTRTPKTKGRPEIASSGSLFSSPYPTTHRTPTKTPNGRSMADALPSHSSLHLDRATSHIASPRVCLSPTNTPSRAVAASPRYKSNNIMSPPLNRAKSRTASSPNHGKTRKSGAFIPKSRRSSVSAAAARKSLVLGSRSSLYGRTSIMEQGLMRKGSLLGAVASRKETKDAIVPSGSLEFYQTEKQSYDSLQMTTPILGLKSPITRPRKSVAVNNSSSISNWSQSTSTNVMSTRNIPSTPAAHVNTVAPASFTSPVAKPRNNFDAILSPRRVVNARASVSHANIIHQKPRLSIYPGKSVNAQARQSIALPRDGPHTQLAGQSAFFTRKSSVFTQESLVSDADVLKVTQKRKSLVFTRENSTFSNNGLSVDVGPSLTDLAQDGISSLVASAVTLPISPSHATNSSKSKTIYDDQGNIDPSTRFSPVKSSFLPQITETSLEDGTISSRMASSPAFSPSRAFSPRNNARLSTAQPPLASPRKFALPSSPMNQPPLKSPRVKQQQHLPSSPRQFRGRQPSLRRMTATPHHRMSTMGNSSTLSGNTQQFPSPKPHRRRSSIKARTRQSVMCSSQGVYTSISASATLPTTGASTTDNISGLWRQLAPPASVRAAMEQYATAVAGMRISLADAIRASSGEIAISDTHQYMSPHLVWSLQQMSFIQDTEILLRLALQRIKSLSQLKAVYNKQMQRVTTHDVGAKLADDLCKLLSAPVLKLDREIMAQIPDSFEQVSADIMSKGRENARQAQDLSRSTLLSASTATTAAAFEAATNTCPIRADPAQAAMTGLRLGDTSVLPILHVDVVAEAFKRTFELDPEQSAMENDAKANIFAQAFGITERPKFGPLVSHDDADDSASDDGSDEDDDGNVDDEGDDSYGRDSGESTLSDVRSESDDLDESMHSFSAQDNATDAIGRGVYPATPTTHAHLRLDVGSPGSLGSPGLNASSTSMASVNASLTSVSAVKTNKSFVAFSPDVNKSVSHDTDTGLSPGLANLHKKPMRSTLKSPVSLVSPRSRSKVELKTNVSRTSTGHNQHHLDNESEDVLTELPLNLVSPPRNTRASLIRQAVPQIKPQRLSLVSPKPERVLLTPRGSKHASVFTSPFAHRQMQDVSIDDSGEVSPSLRPTAPLTAQHARYSSVLLSPRSLGAMDAAAIWSHHKAVVARKQGGDLRSGANRASSAFVVSAHTSGANAPVGASCVSNVVGDVHAQDVSITVKQSRESNVHTPVRKSAKFTRFSPNLATFAATVGQSSPNVSNTSTAMQNVNTNSPSITRMRSPTLGTAFSPHVQLQPMMMTSPQKQVESTSVVDIPPFSTQPCPALTYIDNEPEVYAVLLSVPPSISDTVQACLRQSIVAASNLPIVDADSKKTVAVVTFNQLVAEKSLSLSRADHIHCLTRIERTFCNPADAPTKMTTTHRTLSQLIPAAVGPCWFGLDSQSKLTIKRCGREVSIRSVLRPSTQLSSVFWERVPTDRVVGCELDAIVVLGKLEVVADQCMALELDAREVVTCQTMVKEMKIQGDSQSARSLAMAKRDTLTSTQRGHLSKAAVTARKSGISKSAPQTSLDVDAVDMDAIKDADNEQGTYDDENAGIAEEDDATYISDDSVSEIAMEILTLDDDEPSATLHMKPKPMQQLAVQFQRMAWEDDEVSGLAEQPKRGARAAAQPQVMQLGTVDGGNMMATAQAFNIQMLEECDWENSDLIVRKNKIPDAKRASIGCVDTSDPEVLPVSQAIFKPIPIAFDSIAENSDDEITIVTKSSAKALLPQSVQAQLIKAEECISASRRVVQGSISMYDDGHDDALDLSVVLQPNAKSQYLRQGARTVSTLVQDDDAAEITVTTHTVRQQHAIHRTTDASAFEANLHMKRQNVPSARRISMLSVANGGMDAMDDLNSDIRIVSQCIGMQIQSLAEDEDVSVELNPRLTSTRRNQDKLLQAQRKVEIRADRSDVVRHELVHVPMHIQRTSDTHEEEQLNVRVVHHDDQSRRIERLSLDSDADIPVSHVTSFPTMSVIDTTEYQSEVVYTQSQHTRNGRVVAKTVVMDGYSDGGSDMEIDIQSINIEESFEDCTAETDANTRATPIILSNAHTDAQDQSRQQQAQQHTFVSPFASPFTSPSKPMAYGNASGSLTSPNNFPIPNQPNLSTASPVPMGIASGRLGASPLGGSPAVGSPYRRMRTRLDQDGNDDVVDIHVNSDHADEDAGDESQEEQLEARLTTQRTPSRRSQFATPPKRTETHMRGTVQKLNYSNSHVKASRFEASRILPHAPRASTRNPSMYSLLHSRLFAGASARVKIDDALARLPLPFIRADQQLSGITISRMMKSCSRMSAALAHVQERLRGAVCGARTCVSRMLRGQSRCGALLAKYEPFGDDSSSSVRKELELTYTASACVADDNLVVYLLPESPQATVFAQSLQMEFVRQSIAGMRDDVADPESNGNGPIKMGLSLARVINIEGCRAKLMIIVRFATSTTPSSNGGMSESNNSTQDASRSIYCLSLIFDAVDRFEMWINGLALLLATRRLQ